MSVTRVDYANGVYVTYERMTPESDGYDAGQRWYYVVWTSQVDDHSTGFEVEDCGYAETKAEAVEFARETRESIKFRRSAVVAEPTDELVGRKLVDHDGSTIVVGEPVAESYLDGYRVIRNELGEELDQSYHEDYLATLAPSAGLDPSATYTAAMVTGGTERQFAIVSGETASKMLATSTTPDRLRFRKLAEV